MKSYLILSFLFFLVNTTYAQLNVQLLHQLVEESKEEHERQVIARDNQGKNTINEEVNKELLNTVKTKYRTIQERFAKLSIVFDAAGIAMSASPIVESIVDNQQQIVFYCQQDPILIPLALETERVFVDRSYSLMNYLIGLLASIGDINQMKVSERRLLFQHILNELQEINGISYMTSRTLESYLKKLKGGNPYLDYVSKEAQLVNEIITNVKILQN